MISKEQIKQIRFLHQKKHRIQQERFLLEGPKLLEEALAYSPQSIEQIFALETFNPTYSLPNSKLIRVDEKTLRQLSSLKHPQHVIASCHFLPQAETNNSFKLALDTIQDPGNFGTLLRLAAWFGVGEVIASSECVDCYNPKVVQASMGAIFQVPIKYTDLKSYLEQTKHPVYGALLEGENIYSKPRTAEGIILLGNEGNGIHEELIPHIDVPITIPKLGYGESLNVGTAGAIFLSEFTRGLCV